MTTDIKDYMQLAAETGAYKDIELDILKETLVAWTERPGNPCSVVELRDGKVLAGFAVFARTPGTDYTWDVRAMCVDSIYRGKGVGQRLSDLIEEEILASHPQGIIRFELSRRKEAAVGEGFLLDRGYTLIGHIEAFYDVGDDYFIFAKHVSIHDRDQASEGEANGEGDASEEASA